MALPTMPATASFICRQGTRSPGPWRNISPASAISCFLPSTPSGLESGCAGKNSRGGELFPHLYGPLDLDHVISVEALVLQEDGTHRLPEGVAP